MGLLSDQEITSLLAVGSLIRNSQGGKATAGAAALELSVGDIFVPGTSPSEPGSPNKPLAELCLFPGQIAVIRTREQLALDQQHAAITFPGAFVSLQGLLMTNPGYVHPEYNDHLHVTVINMASEPYCIKAEEHLMRCVFFKLDSPTTNEHPARPVPISDPRLRRLPRDSGYVGTGASVAAHKKITAADFRLKLWQIGLPAVAAALAVAGSIFLSYRWQEAIPTMPELTTPNLKPWNAGW